MSASTTCCKKLVRSKKKSRAKVQRQNSWVVYKRNNLEATEMSTFVAKKIIAHKSSFPSWSSIIWLEMEQFVPVTLSIYNSSNNPTIVTKQELPKNKPEQNPTYQKETIRKEINKHLTTKATSLLNKVLESPPIKLSNSNTINPDVIGTGVLSMDFAQSLNRKNVPISDIYFTLLDAANFTPNLVINQTCQERRKRSLDPFRNLNDKSCRNFTSQDLQHRVLCALWQKQRNSLRQMSKNF